MDSINKNQISDLDNSIIQILSHEHPETIKQLIKLVHAKNKISEQKIIERILLLQDQGKIILKDQFPISYTLKDYIISVHSYWYLALVVLATFTVILILINLENIPVIGNIFIYIRYIFGSIFVLYLPGYSLIKVLMPEKVEDLVERVALSIGMSLAIVAINALIINFTPWGISTVSLTISLLALTLIMSTIAIVREHKNLSA